MTAQLSLLDPPVHRDDPQSSHDAAASVKPKLSGQLLDVLGAVILGGPAGMSNREIQIAVCGGNNPGHPAWNKVATRTKTLWDRGVLDRLRNPETGDWLLRTHTTAPDTQGFLVYRARNPFA